MSDVRRGQRGLRRVLPGRPARAHDDRRRRAAARRQVEIDAIVALADWVRGRADAHARRRRVLRAREVATADVVRHTPVLPSLTVTERVGRRRRAQGREPAADGLVQDPRRAEQAARRSATAVPAGVTAGSAGNHAWALSHAARVRGVPCEVFMPAGASIAKAEGCAALGAIVHTAGTSVDDAVEAARARAEEAGHGLRAPLRRPRRHRRAGHARSRAARGRARPREGRRAASAAAGWPAASRFAIKSARPDVEIVGVQVDQRRGVPGVAAPRRARRRRPRADDRRRHRRQAPGRADAAARRALARRRRASSPTTTSPRRWCCAWRRPSSWSRAPARSASPRCSAARPRPPSDGTTCVILSGGNVDAGLLASVARRHETEAGRRVVLLTRVPDRPGLRSPACCRSSASRGRTSSTSSTCARGSTCTSARRPSSSCSRRAGATTPRRSSRACAPRATASSRSSARPGPRGRRSATAASRCSRMSAGARTASPSAIASSSTRCSAASSDGSA